ncbi:Mitochondrial distribution and morphology protein 10 [Blastocladiella emersonii ATCC 22665]|nr:Mitochondrial distribution and morphology protein 10 [Blastocladiella emersonii ATCC 22665]
MADYLDSCLQQYFAATRWQVDQQYGSLLKDSRAILEFVTPNGFSMSLGSAASALLRSQYTLGLPMSGAIGFLFTSVPLSDDPPSATIGGSSGAAALTTRPEAFTVAHSLGSPGSVVSTYLLYGRIFRDARLEYVLARRLSQRTLFTVSGVSSWTPEQSFVHYNLATNRGKWGHEFCFSSEAALFGFRWLRSISPSFSLGGELYYLANEVSGGMSLGGKHTSRLATTTVTINPLLGHVSTSYTTWVQQGLRAACRYDYNVYSYESDLAVGLAYSPDTDCRDDPTAPVGAAKPERPGTLIRVRYGIARGLALVYQQSWGAFAVRVGLATTGKASSLGVDLSFTM